MTDETRGHDANAPPADPDGVAPTEAARAHDITLPTPGFSADATRPPVQLVTVNPDHFVLGREIARGGMGRIRLARDLRLGRTVAVKEMLAGSTDAARRFEREARITARLQHPSIVNVQEAGVWPTGEPFYVMTFVEGRSLDAVIAERHTLAQRLALVPNVLALADAMAYAHGERIIHRDLKPGNVLVGRFGQTVVVDWGLGKDLAVPDEPLDTRGSAVPSLGPAKMTADGAVLGTPAYISPEQAEGREVDERADVYSLGAILDHVLSGRPPYLGATAAEVLAEVKRGPPPPLSQREPEVPPELLAIVARAMSRDLSARYPTALALAEDLRRFLNGQLVGAHRYTSGQLVRRWLRRHRAPVSVAAVFTVLLAGAGATAVTRIIDAEKRAQAQRELAQTSRGEADGLLDFMLVDLRDKLTAVGKLDLLDEVARRAVVYYEQTGARLSESDLGKRAAAKNNLGDVLARQGHTAAAQQQFEEALALGATLTARDPANVAWQRELSKSHDNLGDTLTTLGNTAGALAEYRAALAIDESLLARDPASADARRDVAMSHGKLGDGLQSQGDLAGAAAEYSAALGLYRRLTEDAPRDGKLAHELGMTVVSLGDIATARGDLDAALEHYREALALADAAVGREPGHVTWQLDQAVGHGKLGETLEARGDLAGALTHDEEALRITEALVANEPNDADHQRDLSTFHNRVGLVLAARGEPKQALAHYRTALSTRLALAEKDPDNRGGKADLASSHRLVASALAALGKHAESIAEYRLALATTKALAEGDANDADLQAELGSAHLELGRALRANRERTEAKTELLAAVGLCEPLAARTPGNAAARDCANAGRRELEALGVSGR